MSEEKQQQQPTKHKRSWWKTLGFIVLLLISLALIFHNQIANMAIKTFQPEVTQATIKAAEKDKHNANYDWKKVNSLTAQQVLDARLKAGKLNFIGYVAVPEIGLSVPISNGVSDLSLSLGAGTLYPDEEMGKGNYALASHFIQGETGTDLMFSPLYYKGKVGQKIYLTDMKHVYEYKATDYVVAKPTDVQWADPVPGKKVVTLITCDYTAERGRVIMQGELQKKMKWEDAPTKVQDSFKRDNRWIK